MADYERYPRPDWREPGRYDRSQDRAEGRRMRGRDDEMRGYAEDRSFQTQDPYQSDFGDRDERTRRNAAGRYGEYRRSDYRGARPHSADMRDDYFSASEAYRGRGEGEAYRRPSNGYESYAFTPYDPAWGFAPGPGYGRDQRREPDYRTEREDRRSSHRSFWDRASDEVASWFGDEDAQARRDRERGEHAGRGPKGYKRSDARILEDVSDRLSHDSWLDASDIEVKVDDGEVTLDGRVASREAKRSAERLAEEVMGVTHVQNNLRLRMDNDRSSTLTDLADGSPTLKASGEAILRSPTGQA